MWKKHHIPQKSHKNTVYIDFNYFTIDFKESSGHSVDLKICCLGRVHTVALPPLHGICWDTTKKGAQRYFDGYRDAIP